VSWAFTGDERIATDWGVRTTQTGRQVLARRTAYNAELPTGGTATFGFEARHGGTTRRPADIRLDGAPCAVR
jgi:cellulose 1,4-beta-cellobiosidase